MPIPYVRPTIIAHNVRDIDYGYLRYLGVTTLVFDLDNTLGPIGFEVFDTSTIRFLQTLRLADGHAFRLCFATNALRDLSGLSDPFDAEVIQPTHRGFYGIGKRPKKPSAEYYKMVLARIGNPSPGSVAMIGDKFVADVCGAMNAGMRGILVKPLGPDLPQERWSGMRKWEAQHLALVGVELPW